MLLQNIRNKKRPNKPNPCRPNKVLLYINSDKLEKEESATKDCRKFSDIKTTHESKMLPKFKKQIKKINIYRYSIPLSWFFMYLIFVTFETGSVKWQTLRNIYIWMRNVFQLDQYFQFWSQKWMSSFRTENLSGSATVMPNHTLKASNDFLIHAFI